jgi:hypothetical protein
MSGGLTVSWHDPAGAAAPPGWAGFVSGHRLPGTWEWPIVRAAAATSRPVPLAATVHEGPRVCALVTARFPGLRTGRRVPLAGVVDIDCLASSAMPGIALAGDADPALRDEIPLVLRAALRREYGRRVRAVMFRQLDDGWLPAVLRWPAVVREGGPIAVFRNRFADFDGYLASLSSRRRRTLRRTLRDLDGDPSLTVAFTGRGDPPGPVDVPTACHLHNQLVHRHHRRWWLRKRLLAPELARAELDHPRTHRLTYHDRDGGLLGYTLVWDHPELPDVSTGGWLPHHEGGRDGLWFHLNALFVRWCIETGRAGLRFGQGSPAEKRRLGYEMCRQWTVLVPQ